MKNSQLNKIVCIVFFLNIGILSGCVTTKDYSASSNKRNIETNQQTPEPAIVVPAKEIVLSDAEVFVLFQKLLKTILILLKSISEV